MAALPLSTIEAPGRLVLPPQAQGLVLVSSGELQQPGLEAGDTIAAALHDADLATLQLDPQLGFGAEPLQGRPLAEALAALADNLIAAIDWAQDQEPLAALPIGLFGASLGGAAALMAAAQRPALVRTVVSLGGRPDLAFGSLAEVSCSILLLVGEQDVDGVELNNWAAARLLGPHRLTVIPGVRQPLEQPATRAQVAAEARDWYARCLRERRR